MKDPKELIQSDFKRSNNDCCDFIAGQHMYDVTLMKWTVTATEFRSKSILRYSHLTLNGIMRHGLLEWVL